MSRMRACGRALCTLHSLSSAHHACELIVYMCTCAHSPRPPPWPDRGHSLPFQLNLSARRRC